MLERKILIVTIIIALILALIPLNSNAANTANFKVSSAEGANGSEVTISVDMLNAADFAAANMTLTYDDSKLEFVSSEKGKVLTEGANSALVNTKTSGKITIGYMADPELDDQTKQAGNVLKAKFKIKDSASGVADLTFAVSTMKQKDGTSLTTSVENGKVTVTKALTSIALNKTTLNLNNGENETLTVSYTPEDTTDSKTVTWTSSNTAVATVENGKVTAVKAGTATITAKVESKTATCNVTVVSPLQSIALNKTTTSVLKGQTETLKITYTPEDTTDSKTATWESSDTTVATIDNGKITAKKAGTTTITAKVGDKTATCTVTVTEIPLNSIAIDKKDIELVKGDTENCSVIYNPNDTTDDKTATWSSSDENIAKVDQNGKITAVAEGETTITVIVGSKRATVSVKVILLPLTSAKINDVSEEDKIIAKGNELQLSILANPTNTTDEIKTVWTSSDEKIATVDSNGKVTGVSAGEVTIKALVNDKFESELKLSVTEEKATDNSANKETAKSEETKTETTKTSILPKTGDFGIIVYSVLAIISAAGIAFIIKRKNK